MIQSSPDSGRGLTLLYFKDSNIVSLLRLEKQIFASVDLPVNYAPVRMCYVKTDSYEIYPGFPPLPRPTPPSPQVGEKPSYRNLSGGRGLKQNTSTSLVGAECTDCQVGAFRANLSLACRGCQGSPASQVQISWLEAELGHRGTWIKNHSLLQPGPSEQQSTRLTVAVRWVFGSLRVFSPRSTGGPGGRPTHPPSFPWFPLPLFPPSFFSLLFLLL